ncbi:MAG: RsmE family RNA methyltransferase [Eggerthellaceae bacterium]
MRIAQRLEAHGRAECHPDSGLSQGRQDGRHRAPCHGNRHRGFVPLSCSRSVVKLDEKRKASKTQRWRAIAKSAAMQSGRLSVPEVCDPMTVSQAAAFLKNATAVLVCWEECPATSTIAGALASAFAECGVVDPRDARIAVVVGPEGGLSAEEVDTLTEGSRAWPVTLGPSILRTETAGVVAPALVMYECGGMGNGKR